MHIRMSDAFQSNVTEKQLLLWVRLWYETKARRFVHLDTSIVKPDPEFDQLARNDYVFGKSASQQDVAKYEQLSTLLKIETSSIFHQFQVISNHRKKKQRNFCK